MLWKIHVSSLLMATSPQRILATTSVSAIGRPNLNASGLTAGHITLGRMVQLHLLNLPQQERLERLAAGKLVVEPDAD